MGAMHGEFGGNPKDREQNLSTASEGASLLGSALPSPADKDRMEETNDDSQCFLRWRFLRPLSVQERRRRSGLYQFV